MPDSYTIAEIPPAQTRHGTTLCGLEFPNGGHSYFYGDSLPETGEQQAKRVEAAARICRHIARSDPSQEEA